MKFNNALFPRCFPVTLMPSAFSRLGEMLGLEPPYSWRTDPFRRLFALKIGRTYRIEAEAIEFPAHRAEHLPGWKSTAGCGMLWVQQRTARLLTQRRFMMKNYRVCPRENGRFYFVINLYDANGKAEDQVDLHRFRPSGATSAKGKAIHAPGRLAPL